MRLNFTFTPSTRRYLLADGLSNIFSSFCSTVPTQDQILVPETLLKKRKSNEKAIAEKLAAAKERKEVGQTFLLYLWEGWKAAIMMNTNTNMRPAFQGNEVNSYTIFRD